MASGRCLLSTVDRRWAVQASELLRSEERYRNLFDRCPAGIYQVSLDGQFLACNQAFADLLGYDSPEVCMSLHAEELYGRPEERQVFLKAMRQRDFLPDHENRLRHRDGREIWVLESARLVPASNGLPDFVQGSLVDVTARKQAEGALLQTQKLESVGRLAAGVAHEINTPIQFVSDSVSFARDCVGDLGSALTFYRSLVSRELGANAAVLDEVTRAEEEAGLDYALDNVPGALDRAMEGLGRVAEIVRSMKEFAHPDQKEMSEVDLNHSIERTLVMARSEYKHVADVEVVYGDIPAVRCHEGDISQVVLNIVVNAAHAIEGAVRGTDRRGRISVRTRRIDNSVIIRIADTGPGIPLAVQQRMFEPFFTTKEVGKGTGQGLAIARAVVEKHGGSLTFQSGHTGTTFEVRLPLAPTGTEAIASEEPGAAALELPGTW